MSFPADLLGQSDLSVEVAHIYLQDASAEAIKGEAEREARWVRPLLNGLSREGIRVSTSLLIDDTSRGARQHDQVEDHMAQVLEACAGAGLVIDYAVRESECESSLDQLFAAYYPEEPSDYAGRLSTGQLVPTVDPVLADERWLGNGEAGRQVINRGPLRLPGARRGSEVAEEHPQRTTGNRGNRSHSIHLDVELWSWERESGRRGVMIPSCPLLAAWWQLLRLGVAVDSLDGNRFCPAPIRAAANPFAARATLTVLPPGFIVVEHAVRAILGRVVAPPEWFPGDAVRPGSRASGTRRHLDRISYLFAGAFPAT